MPTTQTRTACFAFAHRHPHLHGHNAVATLHFTAETEQADMVRAVQWVTDMLHESVVLDESDPHRHMLTVCMTPELEHERDHIARIVLVEDTTLSGLALLIAKSATQVMESRDSRVIRVTVDDGWTGSATVTT